MSDEDPAEAGCRRTNQDTIIADASAGLIASVTGLTYKPTGITWVDATPLGGEITLSYTGTRPGV